MTSVSPVAGNHCGANSTSTFAYDGLHRQVSHTDGPYNLQTVVYHDGFSNNLSMEQHQWLPLIANRDQYYVLDGKGVALADGFGVNGGFAKTEYLGYDGFGNVQRVTNSSGDPIATPFYDPYGAPLNDTIAGHGGAADTLGYKAQSRNGTTGDYHLGLRDYNPASGAFLQPDSFLDSGSGRMDYALAAAAPGLANPRAYVAGDPVNFWDPTGHDICRENPQDCVDDAGKPDIGLMDAQTAGARGADTSGSWTTHRTYRSAPRKAPPTSETPVDYHGALPATLHFGIPQQVGYGDVTISLYIPFSDACAFGEGNLCDRGDDRGPDPYADPSRSRVTLSLDYDTGRGTLLVNPSCDASDEHCEDALPIRTGCGINLLCTMGLHTNRLTGDQNGSAMMFDTHFTNSRHLTAPAIDNIFFVAPRNDAGHHVDVAAIGDPYPSLEAYQYLPDGQVRTLLNYQTTTSPLALFGISRRVIAN